MRRMLPAATLALAISSCGITPPEGRDDANSHLHYITFGPGVTGLVAAVKDRSLKVCLSGVDQRAAGKWQESIKSTVLKWIKPLREMTGDPLADDVKLAGRGEACHFEVEVTPDTWSNTSIGQKPTIRMSPDGYFGSYNVLLHEMGHAFALSDTYQNSQSGNCKPGQPQAVMCNTSFDDLQPDDVSGLKEIFKRTFPGDQPPVSQPQPTTARYQLYAALGRELAADQYELVLSTVGAGGERAGKLSACAGDAAACKDAGASWTEADKYGERTGAMLFKVPGGILARAGAHYVLRYEGQSGTVTREIAIR